MTGKTRSGYCALAAKGATQKLKITPANIALAIDFGIADTISPSFGHNPVSTSKTPQTRMPPITLLKPIPETDEPARSAAPGVDQTIEIGILKRQLKTMESSPQTTSSKAIIETDCSFVAPIATQALRQIAVDAATPVTLATVPAIMGAFRSEAFDANYQADFSCLEALIGVTTACSVPSTTALVILTRP